MRHVKFRKYAVLAALVVVPAVLVFMALGATRGRAFNPTDGYYCVFEVASTAVQQTPPGDWVFPQNSCNGWMWGMHACTPCEVKRLISMGGGCQLDAILVHFDGCSVIFYRWGVSPFCKRNPTCDDYWDIDPNTLPPLPPLGA
jgi:hypothetical protein